jgi:hypothetical protein
MADPARQAERELERSHEDFRAALEDLEARARAELDLGELFAAHPERFMLGAFALGLWLGIRR